MIVLNDAVVKQVLSIAHRSHAVIRANEIGCMPYSLEIMELGDRGIVMHKRDGTLHVLNPASVEMRFRLAATPFQFSSSLLETLDPETALWSLPTILTAKEPRDQLRVPVPDTLALIGELAGASGSASIRCVDVSHAGAKAIITAESNLKLTSGMPLSALITLDNTIAQLDAITMWRTGNTIGILFPSMRKVQPEESYHPWIRIIHRCLLENVAVASIV